MREKMMQQKVNDFEERTRDEERSGEFRKQVIGSPGEEVVSLHFGDHTRTINEKEISINETCEQEEKLASNKVLLL